MFCEASDIVPSVSPIKAEVLSQVGLEGVKEKTLRLMDTFGVHFPFSKALDIFAEHGARVGNTDAAVAEGEAEALFGTDVNVYVWDLPQRT